ncbi:Asp-tRNA(Asn)/Glu-tRNA(Gln) amidotransferase subunit GatC [Candidatus Omnitrophota bacterium]
MQNKKSIDEKTVQNAAKLARISLSDEEIKLYQGQLSAILDYISQLNEVDTANTPPTSHPLESLKNVFRKDAVRKSLSQDEALENAPKRKGDFFSVPKIIE